MDYTYKLTILALGNNIEKAEMHFFKKKIIATLHTRLCTLRQSRLNAPETGSRSSKSHGRINYSLERIHTYSEGFAPTPKVSVKLLGIDLAIISYPLVAFQARKVSTFLNLGILGPKSPTHDHYLEEDVSIYGI